MFSKKVSGHYILFSFYLKLFFFDQSVDVVRFISVYEAKLLEVHLLCVIKINEPKHRLEIIQRHGNAAILTPMNEFSEVQRSVKIDIEVSEGSSVVLELLLNSRMNSPEYLLDIIFLGFLLLEADHSGGVPEFRGIVGRIFCEHRALVEDVHEGLELGETKLLRTGAIVLLEVLKGRLVCTEYIQQKVDNSPGQPELLFVNLVDEFTLSNDAILIFITRHEERLRQQQELEIDLKTSYAFLNLLLFKFVELILGYRSYNFVGLLILVNIHHS